MSCEEKLPHHHTIRIFLASTTIKLIKMKRNECEDSLMLHNEPYWDKTSIMLWPDKTLLASSFGVDLPFELTDNLNLPPTVIR